MYSKYYVFNALLQNYSHTMLQKGSIMVNVYEYYGVASLKTNRVTVEFDKLY